jgi:hypothetical protein
MQLEGHDFINLVLFREIAVDAVIFDPLGQTLTLLPQLLFVEVDSGLLLVLRCCCFVMAWGRLANGERERAPARDIYDRQGRNLQTPFGAIGTAVKEVPQPEGLFAALRNERGILHRDQIRARVERRIQDALMKVRPSKGRPELARHRTLGVVAVATQIATGDAPAQGQDRGKQHSQELPLWLTDRRHLL